MSVLWKVLSDGFNFSLFSVFSWGDDDVLRLIPSLQSLGKLKHPGSRSRPPAAMSKQEQTPSLVKPEVKQRPELPVRSSEQSSSCSPADRDDASEPSEGKVKDIVNKFTKQESREQEEHANNCYSELLTCIKKPPAVKPKPGRISSPPQARAEEAPPLPKKRSRFLNKRSRSAEGVEPKGTSAGGRSGTAIFSSDFSHFLFRTYRGAG